MDKETIDIITTTAYIGLIPSIYLALTPIGNMLAVPPFRKRLDPKSVEKTIIEECENLGIDKKKMRVRYNTVDLQVIEKRISKDEKIYTLEIPDKNNITRAMIRHELWHVKDDFQKDLKYKFLTKLYYILVDEPQAMLYGTFNIKTNTRPFLP